MLASDWKSELGGGAVVVLCGAMEEVENSAAVVELLNRDADDDAGGAVGAVPVLNIELVIDSTVDDV